MTIWLTEDDVALLTGYRRHGWQRKALAKMGIEFRTRPDGFPLVEREQFIQCQKSIYPARQRRREPKFSVIQ